MSRLFVMVVVSLSLGHSLAVAQVNTVPTQGGVPYRAMVDGNWLVWSEAGTLDTNASVYAQNIGSPGGTVRTVAAGTANIFANWEGDWSPQIDVDGGYVVWIDTRVTAGQPSRRVRSLDLSNPVSTDVIIGPTSTSPWGSEHYFPMLDNGTVVWQGHTIMDILKSPVTSSNVQTAKALATNAWPVPNIGGDWVVWKDGSTGMAGGLWARNLATSQEITVKAPSSLFDVRPPMIDGDTIAWCQRDRTGSAAGVNQIGTYDLTTGVTKIVVPDTFSFEHRSNISISGNVLVWEDWRENPFNNIRTNLDVYGMNLVSGEVFPIATGLGNQHLPWIQGNRVVWFDDNGGNNLRWTEISTVAHGDVNLDNAVNSLDISSFVQRLIAGDYQGEADVNADGLVNALDISGFVNLLVGGGGGGGGVVPEAGTAAMAIAMAVAGMVRRGRRQSGDVKGNRTFAEDGSGPAWGQGLGV